MRKKIGILFLITGLGLGMYLLTSNDQEEFFQIPQHVADPRTTHYVPFKEGLLINNQPVPFQKEVIEISQEQAKKWREEAGLPSEGVKGGVIVRLKESN